MIVEKWNSALLLLKNYDFKQLKFMPSILHASWQKIHFSLMYVAHRLCTLKILQNINSVWYVMHDLKVGTLYMVVEERKNKKISLFLLFQRTSLNLDGIGLLEQDILLGRRKSCAWAGDGENTRMHFSLSLMLICFL